MDLMKPEQAAALRKPFPRETVGTLPKPYKRDSPKGQCNECGGYHGLPAVHLDYVGHAATTDRLLSVDPEWTWEPMALDAAGLPMPDREGNLWIRLTVCGVTRIGVGDGGSSKERIGDALRNAAMRFGVALDLWSKEELEQARGPAVQNSGPDEAAPDTASPESVEPMSNSSGPEPDKPITARTRGRLFALFGQKGIAEANQLVGINTITSKSYASRADITEADAKEVIKVLEQRPDAPTTDDVPDPHDGNDPWANDADVVEEPTP
jgi:hypothetical protein